MKLTRCLSAVAELLVALLVSIERGMNVLQMRYEIYSYNLTVSPHYLIKLQDAVLSQR